MHLPLAVAKFEFHLRGHFQASPGRVWAQLVDQEALATWLAGVGALAADGDRFLLRLQGGANANWVEGQVLEVEPRRRLVVEVRDPTAQIAELRIGVSLEASEGGTRFALDVRGVASLVGLLVWPLVRLRAEVAMAQASRDFRGALDAHRDREKRPSDQIWPEHLLSSVEHARMQATAAV